MPIIQYVNQSLPKHNLFTYYQLLEAGHLPLLHLTANIYVIVSLFKS